MRSITRSQMKHTFSIAQYGLSVRGIELCVRPTQSCLAIDLREEQHHSRLWSRKHLYMFALSVRESDLKYACLDLPFIAIHVVWGESVAPSTYEFASGDRVTSVEPLATAVRTIFFRHE